MRLKLLRENITHRLGDTFVGGSDGQSIHLDQERESTSLEAYTFDITHSLSHTQSQSKVS